MYRNIMAFVLLAGISCPVFAAPPDPKTLAIPPSDVAKSRELVQKLGSDQFTDREEAEEALSKMGRLARLALLEGFGANPDPEIRTRCEALLPRANALEMKARLETFLADTEGKYEHDLPGWNQFRATVCNDWNLFGHTLASDKSLLKAARSVFVDLISTPVNKSVVMATGSSQSELTSIVIGRRQELYNQRVVRPIRAGAGGFVAEPAARRDPTAEDVAALLFAESFSNQSPARMPRAVSISVLLNNTGFYEKVRASDEKGQVYKAIITAWLESRINTLDQYQGMTIASNFGLEEQSIKLAVRLLSAAGAPAVYRANAASRLMQSGGKQHIPLLEKLFEDNSVVTIARPIVRANVNANANNEAPNIEIQIRDVALVISIQLAGEKPEEFGFIDLTKSPGVATMGIGANYSYTRYYVPAEKRPETLEKWKQWWAKNKDK